MEGWVKLHRCLMEKAIWLQSTPEQKVILITLLTMANHEEKQWIWQGKKFEAKPGQFVTSLDSIVKQCGIGVSNRNVRTAINKFENLEFLTNKSTKTGRLITIVNWHVYQAKDEHADKDTDKEVTKTRQSTDKEVTANKNVRMKECKKINYSEFVTMTEEEYQKLITEYDEIPTSVMIDILNNYKGSSGKKYKSDYLTIKGWVLKRYQEDQLKGKSNQPYKKEELKLL